MTVRIQHVVTGGPAGDRRCTAVVDEADGTLVEVVAGADTAAEVTITLAHADAPAVLGGSVSLDVAYMQGRVKVAGDPAAVLRVLELSPAPSWEPVRAGVAAALEITA